MDPMPLSAAFTADREVALVSPRYPLTWVRCAGCGLVQVAEDIPDTTLYRAYKYAASTVPALVRHHREYARFLAGRGPKLCRILDVGCNDGVLLRELPTEWDRWGVDPSDVAAEAARAGDWHLVNRPLNATAVFELDRPFNLITSSNAMAHFTDLAGAFELMAELLAYGGELWIEVHDLDATLESKRWDTIYHEHKAEWSARSLANVARRFDLAPIAMWREPLHGGLLRAGFTKSSDYAFPVHRREQFGQLADAYANRYTEFEERNGGGWTTGRLVAYGAAASGVTWLNQMAELGVEFVVDDSPRRRGLYVPGLGIPVLGRDELRRDDRVIITAPNHADDIVARNPDISRWLLIS